MGEKYIYQKFKEVCLLLAGSLISLAFLPFEEMLKVQWFHLLALSITLILIGVGLLDGLKGVYLKLILALNKKRKLIGIYAPYEIDNDNSSWVSLLKRQIEDILRKHKIVYSVFESDSGFKKYPVVVNPYGGVYPENNISTLESLNNIFDYVKRGGVYVNIADIPFYYAFDKNLNRRIDTTPLAGDFSVVRSFLHTILTKKLQVYVYGITDKKYNNKGISRVISLSNSSKNYSKEKITIEGKKYSPFLAIPYGRGYFVFSTLPINRNSQECLLNIINKSLALLI